jgi:hypothetical protein
VIRLEKSAVGQTEKSGWATGKSALPSRTDIVKPVPLARFVPSPDSCTAANVNSYSITSSAPVSSAGGMVRPSAFAVLRLMTSSNLIDCSTGKSAGLAPFRILPV